MTPAPAPKPATPAPLSGQRKAAVFLMGIGESVSAEVLRHLTPDEVRRITTEIAGIRSVRSDQLTSVFREFESLTTEGRLFTRGGPDCARRLVEQAFGPESVPKLLAPPGREPEPKSEGILESADPEQLAAFLKGEHPQTVAVVFANVSPELAARLLKSLPEPMQAEVAMRLAALDRIAPEVLQQIADAIGSRLRTVRRLDKTDGVRALAALLNQADGDRAAAVLKAVEEQNAALADSIRGLMFVFEDIVKIDKSGIKALIAKLDRKILTMALKGTGQKIREHFTQCMSQRSAEMLTEDMDALGAVRIREVQASQKAVIAMVRQLQQSGEIQMGEGGETDYVE
jgi:flagellar motor switch protein FliG